MNQYLANIIQSNEDKIKVIDNAMELVKEKSSLSILLPNENSLKRQKWELEAANEVFEYYQSKLGEREELGTGRHLSVYISDTDRKGGILLNIVLDHDTVDKLYDRVWSSYSDINLFLDRHFCDLSRHILHFDFKRMKGFFGIFGLETHFKEDTLHYSKEEFDGDVRTAKECIDRLFEVFEDKKLMDRVEDALDAYLKAVFESNPEEE